MCMSGQRGHTMVRILSGMVGQWGRRMEKSQWEVISSHRQAPRGGDPTHRDRQHHRFRLFTSLFVFFLVVYLFSFKFYQEVLHCESGLGRPLCVSSLASDYKKTVSLASTRQAAGSVPSTDLNASVFESQCYLFLFFVF